MSFWTHLKDAPHTSPQSRSRIQGLDLARAFAILGMMMVNFKGAMDSDSIDPDAWTWGMSIMDGRAAATFVVLAGVGLTLISRPDPDPDRDRLRVARARAQLARRAVFLFAVGLLHLAFWPPDILHVYGVFLLLALPLLRLHSRALLVLLPVVVALFPTLAIYWDYESTWALDFWDKDGFDAFTGIGHHLLFNGFHPVFPWFAFIAFGLWLGRLDLHLARVRYALLAVAGLAWGGSALASRLLDGCERHGLIPFDPGLHMALSGTQPVPPTPWFVLSGMAAATGLIVLCIELTQRLPDHPALKPLIHTGRMALSIYLAHTLIGITALEALGLLHNRPLSFANVCAVGFFLVSVLASTLCLRRFERGPMEWLIRAFSDAILPRPPQRPAAPTADTKPTPSPPAS